MDPELNPVVHLLGTRSMAADGVANDSTEKANDTMESTEEKTSQSQRTEENHSQKPLSSEETPAEDLPYDESTDIFPGDHHALAAYLVLLGSFLALLATFGMMVSIGTLQAYWQHHQLSTYTPQTIGWIPSVFVYLCLGGGIACGPLFDRYGPRWLLVGGSIAYIIMIFLLAECKEYWQFMLCLGFLGGPAGAALTTTGLAVLSQWFSVRRGLASGLAMVGNSFGGVVIPLVLRETFPRYGYAWSMRILGFVFAACLVAANVLIRPRMKPSAEAKKVDIFSLELFGKASFTMLTVSVFGIEVVLFGALGILPTYASLGTDYPPGTGFYLIAVMNGVSCLGRIIPGFISDIVGRFNVLGVMMVVTLVFILAIWLPFGSTSLVALYVFAALFGFGTGSWMAMVPACVSQLSGPHHFGRYFGTLYFIASLATLVCIPISGALLQMLGPRALVGFTSAVLALSIGTFVVSRWALLDWKWKWKTVV